MRSILALVPEVGPATGPDLTRYLVVCGASILCLCVLAWLFRRTVAGHLRARASRRSLQVLDVLPLTGKQKLVVVRCYDRSFLLGVGDKEVHSIAELEPALEPLPSAEVAPARRTPLAAFAQALRGELAHGKRNANVPEPAAPLPVEPAPEPVAPPAWKEGVVA
jgi:flagellar biogenesis protein FliO